MAPTEVPSKLPGNRALEHHDPVLFDLIEKEKVGYEPFCKTVVIHNPAYTFSSLRVFCVPVYVTLVRHPVLHASGVSGHI